MLNFYDFLAVNPGRPNHISLVPDKVDPLCHGLQYSTSSRILLALAVAGILQERKRLWLVRSARHESVQLKG